jgi:hypothetical protein
MRPYQLSTGTLTVPSFLPPLLTQPTCATGCPVAPFPDVDGLRRHAPFPCMSKNFPPGHCPGIVPHGRSRAPTALLLNNPGNLFRDAFLPPAPFWWR